MNISGLLRLTGGIRLFDSISLKGGGGFVLIPSAVMLFFVQIVDAGY